MYFSFVILKFCLPPTRHEQFSFVQNSTTNELFPLKPLLPFKLLKFAQLDERWLGNTPTSDELKDDDKS